MTRIQWLIFLIVVGLGALLTALFLKNFELVEKEIRTGLQGEARRNALLAAERFIVAMGAQAQAITLPELLQNLPAEGDTILLDSDHVMLNETRSRHLLEWVKNGGHLITRPNYDTVEDESEQRDELLALLEIDLIYQDSGEYAGSVDSLRLNSPNRKALALQVLLDPRFRLRASRRHYQLVYHTEGVHLAHSRLGGGTVNILSDMTFLSNMDIGDYDHAEMLWQILNWRDTPLQKVWLVQSEETTPLLQLIWRNGKPLVIGAVILLLAWLLAAGHRFGPIKPEPEPHRRRLMEHIQASGRFQWRSQNPQKLLDEVRGALQNRLAQVHPGWMSMPEAERSRLLARRLAVPETKIQTLLHDHNPDLGAKQFTALVAELERIRKQL